MSFFGARFDKKVNMQHSMDVHLLHGRIWLRMQLKRRFPLFQPTGQAEVNLPTWECHMMTRHESHLEQLPGACCCMEARNT